jgi:hypothetical protein
MQILILVAVSACVACGSLVGPAYAGDPLFRLQGLAASRQVSSIATAGAHGAAHWQGPDLAVSAFMRLPLHVEFPTFWIDVMSPPGAAVLFQLGAGEPAIGEGYLHVVRSDVGAPSRPGDFLATDYEHALVYIGGEVSPGGLTATYLGAALAPGFHVVNRTPTTELTAPQQLLVEQCIAARGPPSERTRASCMVERLYRLEPAADDLDTVLRFHLESTSR